MIRTLIRTLDKNVPKKFLQKRCMGGRRDGLGGRRC
uniref:Uncharacterized protein n=1 Tax=Acinetobacter phage vB_Ab_164_KEN_03 TaxID=3143022 RepID=A0AAU8KZT3_9VIRU